MSTLEPYYFEPKVLQMPKMISVKTVKWIIAWRIHFADPVKDAKLVASFPLLAQIQVGQIDAT